MAEEKQHSSKDVLDDKKTHFQIEAVQISRILPELALLLSKIESTYDEVTKIHNRHANYLSHTVDTWALEKVKTPVEETTRLFKKIVGSRVFTIEKERKEIINEFFIQKLENYLEYNDTSGLGFDDWTEKILKVLQESKSHISTIIENYRRILQLS